MGLFSGVCSFVSSVASGIGSAIRGVGSALSSFAGKALSAAIGIVAKGGSVLAGLVGTLSLGPLGPVLGPIIGALVLKVISKVITIIGKKLGIIKEKDRPEEIGYRLEEADEHEDWKRREDFASFEEYNEYLKKQIPEDKVDYNKLKENEDRYTMLGTMAISKGCEEKLDIRLSPEFLFEAGKSRMEPSEIQAFADAFKAAGFDSIAASDYFHGRLSGAKTKEVKNLLLDAMKRYYPMKSENDLQHRLATMKAVSKDDNLLKEQYKEEIEKINETGQMPDPKV
jgi:hypothetical protein